MRRLLLFLLAAVLLRWLFWEFFLQTGSSMLPNLIPNDVVIVNKLSFGFRLPFTGSWLARWGSPKRGDIVLFRSTRDLSSYSISRIVGEPGDKVQSENGVLYINDQICNKKIPTRSELDSLGADLEDSSREILLNEIEFIESLVEIDHSILLSKNKIYENFGPEVVRKGNYFLLGDRRNGSSDIGSFGQIPENSIIGRIGAVLWSCSNSIGTMCNPTVLRPRRFLRVVR